MTTVDELIATAAPVETTVSVCGRGDLVALHEQLEAELAEARGAATLAGGPRLVEVSEHLVQVEKDMESATITFKVRSVSRKEWADLLAKYPPTREQRERGLDNDERSFPQAAIAASVVDPELTVEQSNQLAESLPTGEWIRLWSAVLGVNLGGVAVPKSLGASVILRMHDSSPDTSLTETPLAASSSAGNDDPSPSTSTTTTDD